MRTSHGLCDKLRLGPRLRRRRREREGFVIDIIADRDLLGSIIYKLERSLDQCRLCGDPEQDVEKAVEEHGVCSKKISR